MIWQFSSKEQQAKACALLAFSARNTFSFLQPISFDVYESGFRCDFYSPETVQKELLTLISEEMRRAVSKNIPITTLSMLGSNAASFLKKSEPFLSEELEGVEALCEFVEIDGSYFLFSCPEGKTGELKEFSLLSMQLDDDVLSIEGALFEDKKSKKSYEKRYKDYIKYFTEQSLEKAKLLFAFEDKTILLPKAVDEVERIESLWNLYCDEEKIERLCAPTDAIKECHLAYLEKQNKPAASSGQWLQTHDAIFHLVNKSFAEKICNSSLQFLDKLLSMVGLTYEIVTTTSRSKGKKRKQAVGVPQNFEAPCQIQFQVKDPIARVWPISSIEVEVIGEKVLITQLSILSFERLIRLQYGNTITRIKNI